MNNLSITRRSFLGMAALAPLAFAALPKSRRVPVGIELYSVRDQMDKDLFATVRAVAQMGYEVVEFYGPYYNWTPEYAKQVRRLIDDLGIRCHSTHNGSNVFTPESLPKAIELNQILGSKYVIMASAGRVSGADGWKGVAARLTMAAEKLAPLKMKTGFHNHKTEFVTTDGMMPMQIIAANTPANVTLQLDVGTCVEAGKDPVGWIKANKGRITSIHCKEWGTKLGYQALLGEGDAPWKEIFAAAESVGGIEFYLIEQEGSRFTSLETAEKCLATYRQMRGISR
ncbi:MAG: sugar phosphate isomerase/epimerase family protein [Acidobacteriota bacterium]